MKREEEREKEREREDIKRKAIGNNTRVLGL